MSKSDKMAVPTKKQADSSTIQIGACKFCGQTYQLETSGMCTQDQLDEWATEKCDCYEASETRNMKAAEDKAIKNVEKLFGKYDAGAILKAAVHSVAIAAVDSVVVNVGNGIKATLKLNKGKVQVQKTVTETDTLED
ncbi:MAG: hypothetical protein NC517_09915 [Firmicutes bacterium]|nr:hypothetical protein [Bacillota bacterium]